jgi:hypothetical protein
MKKLVVTPEGTFEIELTSEEINQIQLDEQQAIAEQSLRENKIEEQIANKQSALNKLKALGLNDAEIKAIIG